MRLRLVGCQIYLFGYRHGSLLQHFGSQGSGLASCEWSRRLMPKGSSRRQKSVAFFFFFFFFFTFDQNGCAICDNTIQINRKWK
jgi:hypothetical protein